MLPVPSHVSSQVVIRVGRIRRSPSISSTRFRALTSSASVLVGSLDHHDILVGDLVEDQLERLGDGAVSEGAELRTAVRAGSVMRDVDLIVRRRGRKPGRADHDDALVGKDGGGGRWGTSGYFG